MVSKKKTTSNDKDIEEVAKVPDIDFAKGSDKTVIVFKATRPLTEEEHEQLSKKVRKESEQSRVSIILMPYSCDLEGGK